MITKKSGLKKLARSLAIKNPNSIANRVVKHTKICQRVVAKLVKQVQKELHELCSKKHNSMLRQLSFEKLVKFSWSALADEIKSVAPIFYTFMKGCTSVQRRNDKRKKTYRVSEDVVFGVCASVLLRYRNANMNALQRIVSLQLHSGHSGKQVSHIPNANMMCHNKHDLV